MEAKAAKAPTEIRQILADKIERGFGHWPSSRYYVVAIADSRSASIPGSQSRTVRNRGTTRMSKSTKIGRNAGNGHFTTVKTAQSKPATHVVETIKKGK